MILFDISKFKIHRLIATTPGVICDERNNSSVTIDNHELHISIGAPGLFDEQFQELENRVRSEVYHELAGDPNDSLTRYNAMNITKAILNKVYGVSNEQTV